MKLMVMHLWPCLTDAQKAELSEKMLRAFNKWEQQRAVAAAQHKEKDA